MKAQENLDPNELKQFAKLADNWWNKQGPCKPLHDINPLRLNYVKKWVALNNKKILDIGCGGGIFSEALALENAQVTAIDKSSELINVAKTHASKSHVTIDYQLSDAETFAKHHPQQFDVITCLELLEHVPNPQSIVNACAQLLKPKGFVFFSTLNRNPKSYLFAILGAEYILGLLPKGTHDYGKFIRPSECDAWARQVQLTLKDLTGISYNPITQRYGLQNDISVNYLATYQKDHG